MSREIKKIRFADCELQKNASHEWELRRDGRPIYLNSQTLDMLALLLEKPGAHVRYSELEKCSSAPYHQNQRNFIAKHIEAIRKAIGDKKTGKGKHDTYIFIQTISATGYQWIYGDVEYEYGKVKVLLFTFAGIGQEVENGYVRLAITHNIAAAIRKSLGFDITIAEGEYKRPNDKAEAAGRPDCVIEGLCGIERGRYRVIGRIKKISGRNISERQYVCEGSENEFFKFCDEVAKETLNELTLFFPEEGLADSPVKDGEKSVPDQTANVTEDRGTQSEKAYEYYLKGQFLWLKRDVKSLLRGLNYFEQAIAIDPKFYLPLIGIANSYLILCTFGTEHLAPEEAMPRAIVALKGLPDETTLSDKHLSDVYAARATIHILYEWDAERAIRAFETTLDIFPGNDMARAWYAQSLSSVRRFADAIKQINIARALGGYTSGVINATLALVLYRARKFKESILRAKETLELDPTSMRGLIFMGLSQKALGDIDLAIETLERARSLYPDNSSLLGELGHSYGIAGNKEGARAMLQKLELIRAGGAHASHYNDAKIYLSLGLLNECFEQLEQAFNERSPWLTFLAVDPIYDVLKNDSRLIKLKRRVRAAKRNLL